MKYITKPAPLKVVPEGFSFEAFATFIVSTCAAFNESGNGIRAGLRIEDALKRDEPKPYVELTPDQYELLRAAAEKPTGGFPALQGVRDGQPFSVSIARECLPFLDAIAAATDTPPAFELVEAAVAAANQDARPS